VSTVEIIRTGLNLLTPGISSTGASAGIQITTSREMDSQIPRKVTVQYLDLDREYNVGLQYAERLNTAAINAIVLDLPIA